MPCAAFFFRGFWGFQVASQRLANARYSSGTAVFSPGHDVNVNQLWMLIDYVTSHAWPEGALSLRCQSQGSGSGLSTGLCSLDQP